MMPYEVWEPFLPRSRWPNTCWCKTSS